MKLRVQCVNGRAGIVEFRDWEGTGMSEPYDEVSLSGKTFWVDINGDYINPDFIVSGEWV